MLGKLSPIDVFFDFGEFHRPLTAVIFYVALRPKSEASTDIMILASFINNPIYVTQLTLVEFGLHKPILGIQPSSFTREAFSLCY